MFIDLTYILFSLNACFFPFRLLILRHPPKIICFIVPIIIIRKAPASLGKNLVRGAVLRVASDITCGTPLESIKCRVTATLSGPIQATKDILNEGGPLALWAGTPSRTIEGTYEAWFKISTKVLQCIAYCFKNYFD